MQNLSQLQQAIRDFLQKFGGFVGRIKTLPLPVLIITGVLLASSAAAATILIIRSTQQIPTCSAANCKEKAGDPKRTSDSSDSKTDKDGADTKPSAKPGEADKKPTPGQSPAASNTPGSGGAAVTPPSSGGTTPPSSGSQSCPGFPAFPDENCTGVPAGIALTTVSSFSTSSNGQVIDAKLITGELNINHDNVTVKNSRIHGRVNYNNHSGLILQDVDLGADSCPASSNGGYRLLAGDDYTLIRTHLHHNGADLLALGGGGTIVIQDSLFNNTCYYAGDHLDSIQLYDPGSVANVTIAHSRVDARSATGGHLGNAAVFWADNPGAGSRLTMYQNLFAGGNYTTYLLDAPTGSGIVIDVHDNRYVRNTYTYGPCTMGNADPFDGTSGIIWVNNAFSDGGAIAISDC